VFNFCKKKDNSINSSQTLPSDHDKNTLESYCYFLPGSYWIYEDSISKELDSVYVVFAAKGTKTVTEQDSLGYQGIYDWFNCKVLSSYDKYEYVNWMDETWDLFGGTSCVRRSKYATVQSGSNTGTTIFFSLVNLHKKLYDGITEVEYSSFYTSFSVLSNSYSSVQKWTNTVNYTEDKNKTLYFFKQGIGIVRKELIDSSKVWNLKRYKIN
jgi:hypothetical protein